MSLTVTFTGTPLSGTEPLSVVFTSSVTLTADATGGGTSSKKLYYGKLPQYYSRRSVSGFEKVALPQDPVANPVAVEVVTALADLNQRLDRRFFNFQAMLAEVKKLGEATAAFIESQQIADLLQQTEQRIYAVHDAQKAAKMEKDEHDELMAILDAS